MFTGIIIAQSKIIAIKNIEDGLHLIISRPLGLNTFKGQSISINGVCSTVTNFTKKMFSVEYMSETVKRTTVNTFTVSKTVNIEPSLRLGDELGGHLVAGHVDGIEVIKKIEVRGRSKIITVTLSERMANLVVPKGSITVDGISLTVIDCKKKWFTISIVNHTLKNTTLGFINIGDKVNIEIDIIAKYINKLFKKNESK